MNLNFRTARRQRGIALVIVLSFIVLVTVVTVAFFSRVMVDLHESNDSISGSKTEQLARSGLDIVVSDFKQEIVSGSTVTSNGAYEPTNRTYMLPVRSGNPAGSPDPIPNLIRRSVKSETIATPAIASRASNVNSATDPSGNGRVVSKARWNKHYLIPKANPNDDKSDPVTTFEAPDWVLVTKDNGPRVLTAPDPSVIGRYAYAVYDEGGLLDVNVAGFPTSTTAAQTGGKYALSQADLTQVPIKPAPVVSPTDFLLQTGVIDQLVGWRNYAASQPSGSYGTFGFDANAATRYYQVSRNNLSGFLRDSMEVWNNRTNQSFLSRGQLIAFQQSLQRSSGSFPSNALQYLGTFSRELNTSSWGPTQNAVEMGGSNALAAFRYKDNRNSATATNRFLPGVGYANSGTITSYRADGTPYTYEVKKGDPLIRRRFPLDRLAWIGPRGPRADKGGTPENIQACFGLVWGPTTDLNLAGSNTGLTVNVWKYVGPKGTTELGTIAKLDGAGGVAQEAAPREPNFFELLQAGMLTGSLALAGQDQNYPGFFNYITSYQTWPELHVLRIGASILTQSQQPDASSHKNYPVVIEYARNGLPVQAVGVDDLPYLNTYSALAGGNSASSLGVYLLFGLWNPNQNTGAPARPRVRLTVEGSMVLKNNYGDYPPGDPTVYNTYNGPGYAVDIKPDQDNGRIELLTGSTGNGVDGFVDPHIIKKEDVAGGIGAGTSAGKTWAVLPPINGNTYIGYRLPDFNIVADRRPQQNNTDDPQFFLWGELWLWQNANALRPFNCLLEFQSAEGAWIPYCYHAGIDHAGTDHTTNWWGKTSPGFRMEYLGSPYPSGTPKNAAVPGNTARLQPIDPPAGLLGTDFFYYIKYPWQNTDPRSLRFNYMQPQTPNLSPDWTYYLNSSLWSSGTETSSPATAYGRIGSQVGPTLFGAPWVPTGIARNNTTPSPGSKTNPAAYADPDGVQRLADSGLYTIDPASNGWQGDPYALASTRAGDRPIVLHRPFENVAELGYTSRDYPWRSLDFFTAKSADSALLDLFTTSPASELMSAGRTNLNTRNVPVLSALLSKATCDVLPSTPTLLSKPQLIAAKLASLTTGTNATDGPLMNKAEVVTRLISSLNTSFPYTSSSEFGSLDEQNTKARREEVARALCETGQTRTWNLLIDLVAQSGKYPTNATSLRQFNVEGERRYWLHVAIDRFTGDVIDQQLEAVTE